MNPNLLKISNYDELIATAVEHKRRTPAVIHIDGYVKSGGQTQDYMLKPMVYGDVVKAILSHPAEYYYMMFEERCWPLDKNQVSTKLATMHAANEAFLAGGDASLPKASYQLGLGLRQEDDTKQVVFLRDVIVQYPIKQKPELNQALAISAVGGYVASFVLKPGNFKQVIFDMGSVS